MSDARKAEAKSNVAEVEFRGSTFTVPREYGDWPLAMVEAMRSKDDLGILIGALGDAQWAIVQAMGLRMSEVDDLADKIVTALGFKTVGESSPSTS